MRKARRTSSKLLIATVSLGILLSSQSAEAVTCGPMLISHNKSVNQGDKEFEYSVKLFYRNTCTCKIHEVAVTYMFKDMNGDPAGIDKKYVGTMNPGEYLEVNHSGNKFHAVPLDQSEIATSIYFDKYGQC